MYTCTCRRVVVFVFIPYPIHPVGCLLLPALLLAIGNWELASNATDPRPPNLLPAADSCARWWLAGRGAQSLLADQLDRLQGTTNYQVSASCC
jgi:hypothetical protein